MKLYLGAGGKRLPGYVHVDIKPASGIDLVHDLNALPWPWADDSVEMIVAEDVIEHLAIDLLQFCDEAWRVLMTANQPLDDGQPPRLYVQAWNLATALAAFVADGLRTVTEEQYRQRLQICDSCDQRRGSQCLKCGCRLAWKASGRAFQCPLDKWPLLSNISSSRSDP